MKKFISILMLSLASSLMLISSNSFAEPNNKDSMQGIKEIKVLYDMRKSDPNVMLAYLNFIGSDNADIKETGAKPNQRIIFIAESVKFITTEPSDNDLINHGQTLDEIAKTIERLQKLGVKMEVCAQATAVFGVDNSTILPGIKPIKSGFLSLMGWQEQGYRLIPIY